MDIMGQRLGVLVWVAATLVVALAVGGAAALGMVIGPLI
jgi:hypothetical protein